MSEYAKAFLAYLREHRRIMLYGYASDEEAEEDRCKLLHRRHFVLLPMHLSLKARRIANKFNGLWTDKRERQES